MGKEVVDRRKEEEGKVERKKERKRIERRGGRGRGKGRGEEEEEEEKKEKEEKEKEARSFQEPLERDPGERGVISRRRMRALGFRKKKGIPVEEFMVDWGALADQVPLALMAVAVFQVDPWHARR